MAAINTGMVPKGLSGGGSAALKRALKGKTKPPAKPKLKPKNGNGSRKGC